MPHCGPHFCIQPWYLHSITGGHLGFEPREWRERPLLNNWETAVGDNRPILPSSYLLSTLAHPMLVMAWFYGTKMAALQRKSANWLEFFWGNVTVCEERLMFRTLLGIPKEFIWNFILGCLILRHPKSVAIRRTLYQRGIVWPWYTDSSPHHIWPVHFPHYSALFGWDLYKSSLDFSFPTEVVLSSTAVCFQPKSSLRIEWGNHAQWGDSTALIWLKLLSEYQRDEAKDGGHFSRLPDWSIDQSVSANWWIDNFSSSCDMCIDQGILHKQAWIMEERHAHCSELASMQKGVRKFLRWANALAMHQFVIIVSWNISTEFSRLTS